MTTLVQGFTPFGGLPRNPSQELVEALAARGRAGGAPDRRGALVTAVVPTSYAAVSEAVPALMAEHRPDTWIGVGLAAGRPSLSIESVAVNMMGSIQADVEGTVVERAPVRDDGPAAYFSTLPLERIVAAWHEAGIPGFVSQSAGSYLCNMSFYLAAHTAERLGIDCRVGFLHVPMLPEQVIEPHQQPSMAWSLQVQGLDTVLDAARTPSGSRSQRS